MTRTRLPNRRGSETFSFQHEGIAYRATVSRVDGTIAVMHINGAAEPTNSILGENVIFATS